jgi:peptide/nickel transport system permease protein
MIRFVTVRLVQLALVAVGVGSLLFLLLRLSGDPAAVLAGPQPTPEVYAATRERLGLDDPFVVQYVHFVWGLLTLDFGDSFVFREPALRIFFRLLVPSLKIVGLAWVMSVVGGFVIGTFAAVRNGRPSARLAMVLTFVGQAVPYFWLGLLLVLVFAIHWAIFPATGTSGWLSAVLPSIAISIPLIATLARLVRGELLDTFTQPYVLTARSKGLHPWKVLIRHALPNALPPLLAWTGIQFSFLIGTLVIIEPVFNYQGLGRLFVNGVTTRDYPLVQTGVFIVAIGVVAVNIVMDVLSRLIDPRLREGAR